MKLVLGSVSMARTHDRFFEILKDRFVPNNRLSLDF